MDYWGGQAAARKRTVLFAVFYFASVLIIIPFVYAVLLAIAVPIRATANFFRGWYDFKGTFTPTPHPGWWDADFFFWATGITLALVLGGTIYRLWQVSRGGYVIAELLGGTPVDPRTADNLQKRLLMVVEEMAIAAGLPNPEAYILTSERGINAFAAGYQKDDAVVGVTRGCLENLSRDELQAVVASQCSHILNGDTRLKTFLVGLLHGLVYPGVFARRITSDALMHGDPLSRIAALFLFVVFGFITIPLLLVTQIGVAIAGLVKRRATRQRIFLADATAVQFTRNPGSLMSAMKKLKDFTAGSCVFHPEAEESSHFFFASPLRKCIMELPALCTHPPIDERIRRIRPG